MMRCQFPRASSGYDCPNERTVDFEFCPEHLQTPRGRAHVNEVISRGQMWTPSQVQALIDEAADVPDKDYQTTALEKMVETLDRILQWEESARRELETIQRKDWRYMDRHGTEQLRSEVGIYERALDRTAKVLSQISKAAISEKMVTLGKSQVELMVHILMQLISELKLDATATDRAKHILLELLKQQANLNPRVESFAERAVGTGTGRDFAQPRALANRMVIDA